MMKKRQVLPDLESVPGRKKIAPKHTKQNVARTRKIKYFSFGLKEAALLGPNRLDMRPMPPRELGGIILFLLTSWFEEFFHCFHCIYQKLFTFQVESFDLVLANSCWENLSTKHSKHTPSVSWLLSVTSNCAVTFRKMSRAQQKSLWRVQKRNVKIFVKMP